MLSVDADYKGQTTYQRGHQAPNADFAYSQAATNESFYFTNMSAQLGSLNGGLWGQLEKKVRQWIQCGRPELYVITGPVYSDATLRLPKPAQNDQVKKAPDAHRVLVPKKYFKIVYDPDENQAVALELPNQDVKGHKLEEYVVPHLTDRGRCRPHLPERPRRTPRAPEGRRKGHAVGPRQVLSRIGPE